MKDTENNSSKPMTFRATQEIQRLLEKIQAKIESEIGFSIAKTKVVEIAIKELAKARGIK